MCPVNVSVRLLSLRKRHILVAVRAALWLTRRQNAFGCKLRISRAASHAVTYFMRMPDATPPGVGDLQHELTEVLTREELEKRLRKGCKTGDDILARLELACGDPAPMALVAS
jgi:hypothetical protein